MKSKKIKNKLIKFIIFLSTFSIILIFAYYLYIIYNSIDIYSDEYASVMTESTDNSQTVDNVGEESKTVADVLEETTSKIVGISKLKNAGGSIFSKNTETELGFGTGFIVTNDGYIVSNSHVTGEKYSNCYVTLENGETFDGAVVWSDSELDLSITKINAKNLNFVSLGDSDSIRIGEKVYAIGNPIGFEFRRTVTSGIISAKNRTIKIDEIFDASYMTDLIQTDATINPGNSGGVLIYPNGDVIGINTVKISSAEGIGFAIPINIIKPIIEKFRNTGTFNESTIGILAYDTEVIPYLDNSIDKNFNTGIYVAKIVKNGPADNSELMESDIITSIDGVTLHTMNDLRKYIYSKSPGDNVTLETIRGKLKRSIIITLGKKQ
ncbi:MAG: trypsin-like peptidase domain-containing protein [Clostridia bacterium]|nr:trypsin-like peptidase domain-containing protein [Clostridia bacterium]